MVITTCVNSSDVVLENRLSAEYFDPKYVFTPNNNFEWRRIGRILKKCQYGISISMNEDGIGFPIFRMNEIDNCFTTKAKKYANISFREFENFRLQENDILFNRTNSLEFVGRTGIVKDQNDSVFASYLIRIVPNDELVLPEFLTIYLNTEFGIGQVKRRAMPSINQANVSASELKHVLIPLIPIETQKDIANLVNPAYQRKRESKQLYTQAQQLLESELGLDKLEFEKPVGYEANYSEVIYNSRTDADYYQTRFRQLQNHLDGLNTQPLSRVAVFTKGIEVGSKKYQAEGNLFVRVSNVKETGIETGASDKYISETLYQSLASFKPLIDELLLTKDGTPGICYALDENLEGIVSGGIVRLQVVDNIVPIEYLSLVINSKICRMQVERDCSGALILHWKHRDIAKLQIPILSDEKMNELTSLIIQFKQAKHESQKLLEQAKHRVEQLIEEAVTK